MRHRMMITVVAAFVFYVSSLTEGAGPFDSSIVRVTVTQDPPNALQPWTKGNSNSHAGSGFVIDNQRIITNAHVVQYASQVYVQPGNSSDKFEAKVVISAPEVDLALLAVEDETFFENRRPIPMLDGLPKIQSPVNVYGFPMGGEQLSVTEGIISRMDFTALQAGGAGLWVQIDAGLNPGNSGGPAISDNKLIGVAFQTMKQAENIGYLISVEEIKLFLADVADGQFKGRPQLFIEVQTVENDALRQKLNLAKESGGALVRRIAQTASNCGLQIGDVITHVGDTTLDRASRVRVSEDLSLPFTYLVPKVSKDEKVPLKVWRDGKTQELDVVPSYQNLPVVRPLRGKYPRYFICGPLVFSVASPEFLSGIGGQWAGLLMARRNPILLRMIDEPQFEGEELVVISAPLFPHKITKGYGQVFGACVSAVNGTAVKNLKQLVELIRDANGEYLEFDFADRQLERLVFRRAELLATTEDILSNNGIRKQYSDDLKGVWEKK